MTGLTRPRAALSALAMVIAASGTLLAGVANAAGNAPAGVLTSGPPTASGTAPAHVPAPPAGVSINRPTVSLSAYRAAKFGGSSAARRPAGRTAAPAPTVVKSTGFNGTTQSASGGLFPSDSNGAVAGAQVAEIVNTHLVTYTTAGAKTSDRTLNSLAGYSTETLFDPRIVYDSTWKRWVAEAD